MRNEQRARILLADDHKLIADACRKLLEPEFAVVGVVTDGRTLIQAAADLRPDLVILDVFMPQLNGLDAGEQIKRTSWRTKLLYLTMDPSPDIAVDAFRRGASGYVIKNCAVEELLVAMREVLAGKYYLSPLVTRDGVEFMFHAEPLFSDEEKKITERQREILQLTAEGNSIKEIAYLLGLQPGTIGFHKYRMMNALGIHTNAGLIQYAVDQHMISKDVHLFWGKTDGSNRSVADPLPRHSPKGRG